MDTNSINDDTTNDLLSPNLRAKAMKRRRVKLGTHDSELEKSTLELLTALRDPPKSKCSSLKPLPAITTNSSLPENVLEDTGKLENGTFLTALCKTSKHKKSRRKPLELHTNGVTETAETCNGFINQDTLTQAAKAKQTEPSLNHLKPGRRRKTTLESKEKSFIDQLDDKMKDPNKRKQLIKSNELIDEFSFDVKDKSSPRRNNELHAENLGSTPMRNLKLFDDSRTADLDDISFKQNAEKNKVVTRSKRKEANSLLEQSSLEPLSFLKSENVSTDINSSSQIAAKARKPRRNRKFAIGSEFNDDLDEKPVDCESSDVMSVFSDDVTDSYDPSMSSNKPNGRRRTSNLNPISTIKERTFTLCDEQGDSDVTSGGIFTSPKRHKKRSRRATCDAENELFPEEKSNLFPLDKEAKPGLGDGLEGFASNARPHRRRIHNKYLPPLSQNAKKFN